MHSLGIDFISVFGLPPVEFAGLAADLGCRYISTTLQSMDYNPHGYPRYSLRDDPASRRELRAVMRDRGVSFSVGEGVIVGPGGGDQRDSWAADLDIMSELGVERISTLSMDPDLDRSLDQLGVLAETAAAAVGIETCLEFVPCFVISDLAKAVAAIRHIGRPDVRLTLDTMHLGRSGARAADVAALDPGLVGHVQLCDAPRTPKIASYVEEAMYQRMVPGEGELALGEYLAALPHDCVIGLEVPLRSEAEAGVDPRVRMARCIDATRKLLGAGDDNRGIGEKV